MHQVGYSYWENSASLYREKQCYPIQGGCSDGGLKSPCEWPNYNLDRKKKHMEGNIFKTQSEEKIYWTKFQGTVQNARGGETLLCQNERYLFQMTLGKMREHVQSLKLTRLAQPRYTRNSCKFARKINEQRIQAWTFWKRKSPQS